MVEDVDLDYYQDRIYLPSQEDGIDTKEYLYRYIGREFPEADHGKNAVYSIPNEFKKCGEKQASLAEQVVFEILRGLSRAIPNGGLWMMFFHGAVYGGRSSRSQRIGKLMIREHDFVVFVRYQEKCFTILMEVKSTHDGAKFIADMEVTSDAKAIKNNKRSAQHQLRDHMEVLRNILQMNPTELSIQCYITWPFLSSNTRDPKQNVIKRWKDDHNLHVYEDTLSEQAAFNRWFNDNVLSGFGITEEHFITLLSRYVVLSCGVFVDEIHEGMLALLTQEQLELLTSDLCKQPGRGPMVVHGAAGTGKTLLVLRKLQQLHQLGQLDENNRALYVCYWPGIRFDLEQKLKRLGLDEYVDTARFYISQTGFLQRNSRKYKHIFVDESEAVCLAFDANIISKILSTVFLRYHNGNCTTANCEELENPTYLTRDCRSINHRQDNWGELWFLVDINQASLFLPRHSPQVLKAPNVVLNKVMRSSRRIFNIFKQFYSNPMPKLPESILAGMNLSDICVGHHINGPPIFWASCKEGSFPKEMSVHNTVVNVVIDLCATKGFKANDICVIPFLVNDRFSPESINRTIDRNFVENAYRPRGIGDVEKFLSDRGVNDFLVAWALRVKGLEFKVVVMVIEDEDFDPGDSEDRRKTYIMASRCTCLLILVSSNTVKDMIDVSNVIEKYPFCRYL